jgi:hypothetical protein
MYKYNNTIKILESVVWRYRNQGYLTLMTEAAHIHFNVFKRMYRTCLLLCQGKLLKPYVFRACLTEPV